MSSLRLGIGSLTVLLLGAAGVFACADDEPVAPFQEDGGPSPLPGVDASSEGGADGGCSEDGGCQAALDCALVDFCATEYPVGRTTTLGAIWGSGRDDVWIVGTRGAVVHGNGAKFTVVPTGSSEVFFAVWGTSKTDVWFLDGRSPLHSTGFANGAATLEPVLGSSWNDEFSSMGRLWAGCSTSPDTVWLGGEPTSRFTDTFGNSSSFWQLGVDPDGGVPIWNRAPACSDEQRCTPLVRSFWAADPQNVWAVGMKGQSFVLDDPATGHWAYRNPQTNVDLDGVWGSSASDVWAVGNGGVIRHAGADGAWTIASSPTTEDLHAIWGSSASDVWAVGNKGTVVHYDGSAWTLATIGIPPGDVPADLLSVWGSGADDVWAVGRGHLLHRTSASRKRP